MDCLCFVTDSLTAKAQNPGVPIQFPVNPVFPKMSRILGNDVPQHDTIEDYVLLNAPRLAKEKPICQTLCSLFVIAFAIAAMGLFLYAVHAVHAVYVFSVAFSLFSLIYASD